MTRFAKTSTADLLDLLRYAARKKTNPFAVMDGLREVLSRGVTPPELGEAVLTFDATLAGEARDALEGLSAPIARFLQACVPMDVDGLRVESAWQSAAHALTRLVRLEKKPKKAELAALKKLAVDDVFLEGAQVALATANPAEVEANRWFLPLLMIDGSEVSVDALLPHVDAALSAGGTALEAFKPLRALAPQTNAIARLVERL
ncbi:MAG: hypothetical protein Q8N26_09670 [Myxococcales bacterium]|nr:hypothetical protein [Myxococcales bacterium]